MIDARVALLLTPPLLPSQVAGGEVIVKYCPLCSKPHYDKPDNMWKLYFSQASGAYNCFRCGCAGSLFHFKEKVPPPLGQDVGVCLGAHLLAPVEAFAVGRPT